MRRSLRITAAALMLSAPFTNAAENVHSAPPPREAAPGTVNSQALNNPFYRECVLKHLDKARTREALQVLLAICRRETQ
jgi:hypothetical protein